MAFAFWFRDVYFESVESATDRLKLRYREIQTQAKRELYSGEKMASSSIRTFGAFLYRFSSIALLSLSLSLSVFTLAYIDVILLVTFCFYRIVIVELVNSGNGLLRKSLSSSSSFSLYLWVQSFELQSLNSKRKIWTFSPLCMGRRSCKIADRKVSIPLWILYWRIYMRMCV